MKSTALLLFHFCCEFTLNLLQCTLLRSVILFTTVHLANSLMKKQTEYLLCVVKVYILFFAVISFAETIFTATYFLITQKIDKIILLGFMIYTGAMIIGYIAYKVEKYRRRKKELLESLPDN